MGRYWFFLYVNDRAELHERNVNRKGHFENYETLTFQDVWFYFLTCQICLVYTKEMYICHQNTQDIVLKKGKMLAALKKKKHHQPKNNRVVREADFMCSYCIGHISNVGGVRSPSL